MVDGGESIYVSFRSVINSILEEIWTGRILDLIDNRNANILFDFAICCSILSLVSIFFRFIIFEFPICCSRFILAPLPVL